MTLTTAAWIAVVATLGTTALRVLRPRPAPVPVRAVDDEHEDLPRWRPRVTSGCGR